VNSDAILIMGSNMAENHPVGFQWVIEARERGAKVIHVDPRFSRTSAMANIWAPLRAGSDILFLGGLIRYVLENKKEFRDYVIHYTNASSILPEDFKDTEDVEGVFSGWDAKNRKYDSKTWFYDGCVEHHKPGGRDASADCGHSKEGSGTAVDLSDCARDLTLSHARSVYQVLKRHFAWYTPELRGLWRAQKPRAKPAKIETSKLLRPAGIEGPRLDLASAVVFLSGRHCRHGKLYCIRCAIVP
jgi:formate dehydrogenase major subunit